MSKTAAVKIEDFAAFVARYHTDVALRKLHFIRLFMGLGGASLAILFNVLRLGNQGAEHIVTQVATVVCVLHVVGCFLALYLTRRRYLADFARPTTTLKDRAWQVVSFVQRRGNIVLVLAATGHVLVVFGTMFRLRLFADDGGIMLVTFIPTVLFLIHGLSEIPTQQRLVRLYDRLGAPPKPS
jgi:hypothetical protein